MPDLGWPELLIIIVIVVVVFGAGRLPEAGGALGRTVREFRSNNGLPEKEIDSKTAPVHQAPASTKTGHPSRPDDI